MFKLILSGLLVLICSQLHAQTITNFTTSEGLPDNDVTCLVHDGNGAMWFGTAKGVAKYDGVDWAVFTTTSNATLPNDAITAIAIGNNDEVWVGTDQGTAVFDGTKWTAFTTADGLGSNRINYISRMSNGDVWFGDFNGATHYDGSKFTAYGNADGLPFGGIVYIEEDTNGDVLMCSGLGGFIVFDGTSFTTYSTTEGLVSKNTTAMALDNNGNKWVGTASGVTVLDASNKWKENHTRMLTIPAPDTLNPVEDIEVDEFGQVWVGIYVDYLVTVGGVAMYDGSKWTTFDGSNGLVGPTVRKIELDGRGNLWVGTSSGVSKISNPITASVKTKLTVGSYLMFPNPAIDELTISNIPERFSFCEVNIFNGLSQHIISSQKDNINGHVTISISGLEVGIYYVECNGQIQRLIVQ
jgi:ligand-binding sensor domain-containing protein